MVDSARSRRSSSAVPTGLFIGGEWRPAGERRDLRGRGPLDRPGAVPRSPTPAPPTRCARSTRPSGAARLGRRPAPGAQRDPPPRLRPALERQEELALLMTLEMGKPLAEARGEIAYAAEFFRWFSEEAVRIDGGYAVAPNGQGPLPRHAPAGRPVPPDHAVELPDGHGHPQDRPGRGGRLHDGGQARRADPAVDAGARRDHAGGRSARRRPQPRDHHRTRRRDGAADPRRPGPQALLHRLHRRSAASCSSSAPTR